MVYPHLTYGVEVWGNTNKSYKGKVKKKLQKRAVRCINYSQFLEHTMPLFSKLHILQLNEIVKINIKN